jgi:Tfp pilus assembly PilM family ATPase
MVKMKLNFRAPGLNVGFANRSPIGLDVGARWVKAAQLRREGAGRWHLEAAARFPRLNQDVAADAKEARRIEEVLSRQGFRGRDVVLAAPTEKLMTDLLELPARTPATPFEQIMRAEVARIHRCDASKLEIAHWDVPTSARTARGTQVLSVACQHADAEAVLDVFESVGLNVVGLDARSVAVARACGPVLADVAQRISVILMLDWNQASVVVMHQGVVVYERRLKESGIRRLHETIRTQLNLEAVAVDHVLEDVGLSEGAVDDPAASSETVAQARGLIEAHLNAIVQDLRASLTYASHQYPEASAERVLVAGEGAAMPGVDRQLAGRTGLEVRKASAAELVSSPNNLLSLCTPALTAAVGLAQYEEY